MHLNSISAFKDNYIWILNDTQGHCLIVDPGEAPQVIEAIEKNEWQPEAILLTHHHHDHTGGVRELLQKWPQLSVYGPEETRGKGATQIVKEGDTIPFSGHQFKVIAAPGHTLGHVLYYSKPYLFCGDTIFSGGSGRLFEGTPEQMFQSFQKINKLPGDTLICCAHEYTLNNLKFSHDLLPDDKYIENYYLKIKQLREYNEISVPTTLETERKINLFLRIHDIDLQKKLGFYTSPKHLWKIFATLRDKKDRA